MSTPFHTLSTLIARLRGHLDWYSDFNSLARHVKQHDDDIGNLSVGSAPGVFAAYDTRFYVTEDSMTSNAYAATLSPAATGQAMPTGYSFRFMPSTANTGSATLDVGSTDGALTIKKFESGSKVNLASGDLVVGKPVRLTFDGTHLVLQFIPAPVEVLDEDDFASDSATKPPSQQSAKAYTDGKAGSYGLRKVTYYTTGSGTHNFQTWKKRARITLVGGGGGGAGDYTGGATQGIPGGGGGYSELWDDTDQATIGSASYAVGGGGSGGAANANGSNGGNSTWSDGTNSVTAGGGDGGNTTASSSVVTSNGGSASGGTINIDGSASAYMYARGVSPGSSVMGAGQAIVAGDNPLPGGGGGAGFNGSQAGGDGGDGLIIVEEFG